MIEQIIQVARECGVIMKEASADTLSIEEKSTGKSNYVTRYDTKIQAVIRDRLYKLYPDIGFLGEENDECDNRKRMFVVDPIDGTANFVNHYSNSAISIGLLDNNEPVLGVVYQPYLDEMFAAEKGKGATLNGKKITVSSAKLADSLVEFCTTPYYPELEDRIWSLARKYYKLCSDVRWGGSAVLGLINVACGRTVCYQQLHLYPWDVVAAACIIKEAGGIVTNEFGLPIEDWTKDTSVYARANDSIPIIRE